MRQYSRTWRLIGLAVGVGLATLCHAQVAVSFVTVGEPGNPDDATGFGSVSYEYRIGSYEVTNAEYVAFLNAVARTDANELFNAGMAITRSGSPGSYSYTTDMGSMPVVFVSWFDAARFANWLHNGQPAGPQGSATTEDGAYTFTGPTDVGARNQNARFFVPTENEWYKAAYYEPGVGYWEYATQSEGVPVPSPVTDLDSHANFDNAVGGVTPVGSYGESASSFGTYDQAGNVWEWNETEIDGDQGIRGGSWDDYELLLRAWYRDSDPPASEHEFLGFRIAAVIPSGVVEFRRGDVNQDGSIDIADAISTLSYLFGGASVPACLSAADSNDDGNTDIGDAVAVLSHLFAGAGPLPAPFPGCGEDPTPDGLGCMAYTKCSGE